MNENETLIVGGFFDEGTILRDTKRYTLRPDGTFSLPFVMGNLQKARKYHRLVL